MAGLYLTKKQVGFPPPEYISKAEKECFWESDWKSRKQEIILELKQKVYGNKNKTS